MPAGTTAPGIAQCACRQPAPCARSVPGIAWLVHRPMGPSHSLQLGFLTPLPLLVVASYASSAPGTEQRCRHRHPLSQYWARADSNLHLTSVPSSAWQVRRQIAPDAVSVPDKDSDLSAHRLRGLSSQTQPSHSSIAYQVLLGGLQLSNLLVMLRILPRLGPSSSTHPLCHCLRVSVSPCLCVSVNVPAWVWVWVWVSRSLLRV
eukprot:431977-Rhodomonas_salina.2